MRKLRHREVEQLDQGHSAKQVMMLDFKHRSCHCKACALTPLSSLALLLDSHSTSSVNHLVHADTALGAKDMAGQERPGLGLLAWILYLTKKQGSKYYETGYDANKEGQCNRRMASRGWGQSWVGDWIVPGGDICPKTSVLVRG